MKIDKSQAIYVVDDDKPLNGMICKFLEKQGFKNVKSFYTGEDVLGYFKANEAPIIIQDFDLPGINGIEVLTKTKVTHPKTDFIFLSGQSTIDVAVDSIKQGAFDYIVKDNFAKENVHTKIIHILKIRALSKDRIISKYLIGTFLVLLLVSWFTVFVLFYNK